MVHTQRAPRHWSILVRRPHLVLDGWVGSCRDGVLGERRSLRSAALLLHWATVSSWSYGNAAARLWDCASAVELDPLRGARRKRAGVRARVGQWQVREIEGDGSSEALQPVKGEGSVQLKKMDDGGPRNRGRYAAGEARHRLETNIPPAQDLDRVGLPFMMIDTEAR